MKTKWQDINVKVAFKMVQMSQTGAEDGLPLPLFLGVSYMHASDTQSELQLLSKGGTFIHLFP